MFKQPIANLRNVLNDIEKIITQSMSGNESEDFAMRVSTLQTKKENIAEELNVLVKQAVHSHLDELTNAYVQGDADLFESIASGAFVDIQTRYEIKLTELKEHVERSFTGLNLYIDNMSNLQYLEIKSKRTSELPNEEELNDEDDFGLIEDEKKGFFDFLKSRKKREKEKAERLKQEAELRNKKAQYKMQETIRRKQEARQSASYDLDELYRELDKIVKQGLDEKFNDIITQIQDIDGMNKQALEDGKRQMSKLKEFRHTLDLIETSI